MLRTATELAKPLAARKHDHRVAFYLNVLKTLHTYLDISDQSFTLLDEATRGNGTIELRGRQFDATKVALYARVVMMRALEDDVAKMACRGRDEALIRNGLKAAAQSDCVASEEMILAESKSGTFQRSAVNDVAMKMKLAGALATEAFCMSQLYGKAFGFPVALTNPPTTNLAALGWVPVTSHRKWPVGKGRV